MAQFPASKRAKILASSRQCAELHTPPVESRVLNTSWEYTVGTAAWALEEDATLERIIASCPAELSMIRRCAAVVAELPSKTLRDVAARIRLSRDQHPDTANLAAVAVGASAAAAGLEVPAAEHSSWRDPTAMLNGSSSVRATMEQAPPSVSRDDTRQHPTSPRER